MKKFLQILMVLAVLTVPWVTQAQTPATTPYTCGFEDASENANWTIVNGTQTNKWVIGHAAFNGGGDSALYISNDNGVSNTYNNGSISYVYAYRGVGFTAGQYALQFDWRNNGESTWDVFRAFLVPTSVVLNAGDANGMSGNSNPTPSGWIDVGGGYRSLQNSWQTNTAIFDIPTDSSYNLVFFWKNDGSGGSNPPAAIDNVNIIPITCPQPINFNISNITSSGVDISWVESGTATSWVFEYADSAFTPGTNQGTVINASDTTVFLTNLSSNTLYYFYVHSDCGDGDTSLNYAGTFRTSCDVIVHDSLPYTYGFEDATTGSSGAINPCWRKGVEGTTTAYPYASNSYVYAGSKSLYFYANSTVRDWVVVPNFEDSINALQIRFWAKRSSTSYSGKLKVGVMTNPTDATTFTSILTVAPSVGSTNFEEMTVPLGSYHGTGSIAIMCDYPDAEDYQYNYVYIDDIIVEELPACPLVVNLTATVATDSMSVSWSPSGSESSWMVACGSDTAVATTNSYTFQNLTAATLYTVSVWALCDDGDTSDVTSGTFRTSCNAMLTVPFIENFDSYIASGSTVRPSCWIYGSTYNTTFPYVSNSYHFSGANSLYMYDNVSSPTANTYTYLVSPPIDTTLNPIRGLETIFKYMTTSYSTSSYPGTVIVGIMTDSSDFATFYPIDTVYSTAANSWAEGEIDFASYPDSLPGRFVAFVSKPVGQTSTGYAYNYVYMDDIGIYDIPTCRRPISLVSTGNTASSVTLQWVDTIGNSWEVAYGETGFDPDTAVVGLISNISDDSLVVTGLTTGTTYDFYVRTDCGGEYSWWRGPVTSTPGSYNMAVSGTASITGCGLTVYDNGGPTGDYAANCNSTLTVYPTSTDSVLVIQGTCTDESCCDHLYIYDGSSTLGTLLGTFNGSNLTVGPFTSASGPLTIVFTSDGSVQYAGYELHVSCIGAPQCAPINTVSVQDVAVASAMASWTYQTGSANIPQSYELEVTDSNGTATTYTTNNMYYLLSNLIPAMDYTFKVRTICGEGVYGAWDSTTFRTRDLDCTQVDSTNRHLDTIGTGTTTNNYLPSYSLFNHGFSQQIYLAGELSGSCLMQSMEWQIGNVAQDRVMDIYMANVSDSSVNSWIVPSVMTLVWSGTTNFTANSWNTITFDTPFAYDGTSNLLVIVNDHSSNWVSGNSSNVHSIGSRYSRYIYNDVTLFDPQNPSAGGSGSTLTMRQNAIFHGDSCTAQEECAAPNVFVPEIFAHQANVIWAPGYQETSWEVAHKATTDATWTIDQTSTTNTSYTVTGLTANTEYQFRVTGSCNGNDYSSIKIATTPCEAITSFPFTENFDTWATGSSAAWDVCWHKGSDYNASYPYVTTSYAHSGTNAVYMYSSSSTYSYFALPQMGVSVDSLQISFALYRTNTSYSHALTVGVMTDPTDVSTFVALGTAAPTLLNTWEIFELPLSNYSGTGRYIAVMSPNTGYCYPYLDDIEVNYIPSCPRPTHVTSSNITTTGATISWVDTNTTDFEIEYGPVGFTQGTGLVVTSNSQTVALTGLTHSINYDVYVRGICTGNDTSYWSFVHTFATACAPIDHLPFTENFNYWGTGTTVHGPNCWTDGSTYSTSYPYIYSNTAISNSPFLYMYCYNSSTSNYLTYATLPMLDSTTATVNQVELVFDITRNSNTTSYDMNLVVGVTTTPGSFTVATFTPIDTIVCPAYGTWETVEVPFDTYTGSGKYVTFYEYATSSLGNTYAYSYIAVDNVVLEAIPTCRRPIELTAGSATQNSVTLGWTERSNATAWVVEYGPRGFALGTGTQVVATSNPFILTGLPSSYVGEYYVRAVCTPNSDSSEYSRSACAFCTTQIPATIPYNYDFETATEWANWQTSSNNTIHWQRGAAGASTLGSGSNGMYVTGNDSNAVFVSGVNNVTAYRDIDFGTTDSSFIVAFDAMMGGNSSNRYDGLMVFLVDPSTPVISSTSNITSPWGNVNNLYRIADLRVTDLNNNGWTHFEGIFDTIHGIHRVAFFWFNQSTSFDGEMGKVDNITVDYAACPRPVALQATPTDVSAALSWVGPGSASYEIIYREASATTNMFAYSNTNSFTLTGLTPLTTYYCGVRKLCGSDTSFICDIISFETDLCAGAVNDTIIGTGSNVSESAYPVNNYWNYSYTQTIIDSAELNGVMDFSAIAYQYTGASASSVKNSVNIYMGHTNQSTFASSSDFLPIDSMMLVYSGPLNCSAGWNLFGFDTVFSYSGVGNIVVAVDDNSGDYDGTAYTYASTACVGNKTIHAYSDSDNPDPTNMSSFSGSTAVAAMRVNMQLIACGAACRVPTLISETHTYDSATVTWTGESTDYEVAVKAASAPTWPAETAVSAYTYTFGGLNPATTYLYRIRQICDSANTSDWYEGTFITDSLPCFAPANVTATPQGTTADIDWTPGSTESSWLVNVYNSTFNQTYTATEHPYTVTDLIPDVTYNVTVSAICGNATDTSDWSTPIIFSTESCDPVTNVTVSSLNSTGATITWTAGENNTGSWQLEYGYADFGQGEGTSINTTTNSATLTGLMSGLAYDVYVRAICGPNYNSNWSTRVRFTPVGIENVTGGTQLNLYPNPTTGSTTITLSGVQGSVTLTIVDMSGRTVKTETMECSGDCAKKLDVNNLSQGAYFVRVSGENVNIVKKLIVK